MEQLVCRSREVRASKLDEGTVEGFIAENRKLFSKQQRKAGLWLLVCPNLDEDIPARWVLCLAADKLSERQRGSVYGLVRDRASAQKLAKSVLMLLSQRA